jgi:hypothetical protein
MFFIVVAPVDDEAPSAEAMPRRLSLIALKEAMTI